MHILLYSLRFLPQTGGLQWVAHAWSEALAQLGHRVTVLTATPGSEAAAPPDYAVVRTTRFRERLQRMRQADAIIHMDLSLPGLLTGFMSRRRQLVTHHTALLPRQSSQALAQTIKWWMARNLRLRQTACSSFIAADIPGALVLHSPYRPAIFFDAHGPRQPKSLLFVGRLVSIKGASVLVDAMRTLAANGYTLTLVGDGPERSTLEQQVQQLGLQQAVRFDGVLAPEQVAALMNCHEVLVVPSLEEPFGTVVLEGLACGCRVVASHVGGLPEAVDRFGWFAPPGDAGLLAEVVQQASTSLPPDQAGLAAFLQEKTPAATVQKLLALLA